MDDNLVKWFGDAYDAEAATLRVKLGQTVKGPTGDAEEAVLSEPLLEQYEAAMKVKPGIERDRTLLAYVSGLTPMAFVKMPVSQYNKAMAFLGFFANAAPPIGENGSGN